MRSMPTGMLRLVVLLLVAVLGRPALAQPFGVSTYEADGTFVSRFLATMADMHIDDIEIGPDGNIWLARADNSHSRNVENPNDMLAIFDTAGTELGTVQGGGMRHPTAVTWDSDGNIFLAGEEIDFTTNIYKYDATGAFLVKFRTAGWNLIDVYNDLVMTGDDRLYAAAWWGTGSADQMTEFDTSGGTVSTFSPTGPQYFHRDMTLGTDRMWVRTPRNGSGDDLVREFDLAGTQTGTFNTSTISDRIVGLRLGASGNLFTYDLNGGALLELTTAGDLVGSTTLPGLTPWVTDFAFTASGRIIVAHQLPPCPGDVDDSRVVDFADILPILAAWGPCEKKEPCPEDLDQSGAVDFGDVLVVLANWGPCP